MTLSLVPKSRWQTLLHLDLIKQRNKPTEAPKVPEKAPFFLGSLDKPKTLQGAEEKSVDNGVLEKSRIMQMDRLGSERPFTVALRSGGDSGDCTFLFYFLTFTRFLIRAN
jgi:U3 small nucleolar RNA-associated protein 21